jgi:hypothetical protein
VRPVSPLSYEKCSAPLSQQTPIASFQGALISHQHGCTSGLKALHNSPAWREFGVKVRIPKSHPVSRRSGQKIPSDPGNSLDLSHCLIFSAVAQQAGGSLKAATNITYRVLSAVCMCLNADPNACVICQSSGGEGHLHSYESNLEASTTEPLFIAIAECTY